MSKDSKKRQELKRQISKNIPDKFLAKRIDNSAQTVEISLLEKILNVLRTPKKYDIIERSTTFPTSGQPEVHRFIICFDYLNKSSCNFEQFNPAKGRRLLEIFERVAKCEINKFSELHLSRSAITKTAPYESLFSTVSPDLRRIDETELCDGRLFYFIIEPYFNVVSVETKHRDIY